MPVFRPIPVSKPFVLVYQAYTRAAEVNAFNKSANAVRLLYFTYAILIEHHDAVEFQCLSLVKLESG